MRIPAHEQTSSFERKDKDDGEGRRVGCVSRNEATTESNLLVEDKGADKDESDRDDDEIDGDNARP